MTSAGREVLKWIALVLMTGDHVNKALLDGSAPWLTEAGRVVFPIFAFVLAWNMQHASADSRARAMRRLLLAGVLVQPAHALVFGFWTPATVLLTLAAGIVVADPERPSWLRAAVMLIGAVFVDYQWPGVLFVAASFYAIRHLDGMAAWGFLAAALVPLCLFNGNAWALVSLPLLWWLGCFRAEFPRHRWTFLGYYAAHLLVLAAFSGHVLPALGSAVGFDHLDDGERFGVQAIAVLSAPGDGQFNDCAGDFKGFRLTVDFVLDCVRAAQDQVHGRSPVFSGLWRASGRCVPDARHGERIEGSRCAVKRAAATARATQEPAMGHASTPSRSFSAVDPTV